MKLASFFGTSAVLPLVVFKMSLKGSFPRGKHSTFGKKSLILICGYLIYTIDHCTLAQIKKLLKTLI